MVFALRPAHAQSSRVVAWGSDVYGQLGDGYLSILPHPIINLTGVQSIAAGNGFTAALKSDGTVWTWGGNFDGALGDGTTVDNNTPRPVAGLTGITAISAGAQITMALKSDGTVWAWGDNGFGAVGDGTTTNRLTPTQVMGPSGAGYLTGIVAISAGAFHSVALKSDGTVWAWGGYNGGTVGGGYFGARVTRPLQTRGPGVGGYLTGVIAISAGDEFTAALKSDGTVWTWGNDNNGELGGGQTEGYPYIHPAPLQVLGPKGQGFLTGITQISAGTFHMIALKSDGTVYAWGDNERGSLGQSTATANVPNQVPSSQSGYPPVNGPPLSSVKAISAGGFNSGVALQDGRVYVWGDNQYGQIANGMIGANYGVFQPTQVLGQNGVGYLSGIAAISVGYGQGAALTPDGRVFMWGSNNYGELGDGRNAFSTLPTPTLFDSSAVSMACSDYQSVVVRADGSVWTAGSNDRGQLGNGATRNRGTPTQVLGVGGTGFLSGITRAATRWDGMVGLKPDGTVWTWGGYRSTATSQYFQTSPQQVVGPNNQGFLTGIIAATGNYYQFVTLKSDGTVWTWGDNSYGQLGVGDVSSVSTPVRVVGLYGNSILRNIIAVASGQQHSIALKSDGTLYSWGNNYYGALGNSNYTTYYATSSQVPIPVMGPGGAGVLAGVKAIAAGAFHSVALKSDGTVWTWGDNSDGQLGNSAIINKSLTPVQVVGPNSIGFLTNIVAIAAGDYHTVAMKSDGTVWTWGYDNDGELGNGTHTLSYGTQQMTPVQVLNMDGSGPLTGVKAIAAGGKHTLALLRAPTTVSGIVTMRDWLGSLQQPITFQFRPTDGSDAFTRTQTLGADGSFHFGDIPDNQYRVAVKAANWLQQVVNIDTNAGAASFGVTLPGGDANNDNTVDPTDFGILVDAYDTSASVAGSGYDARADFNGDGVVDNSDFGILIGNYNLTGAP